MIVQLNCRIAAFRRIVTPVTIVTSAFALMLPMGAGAQQEIRPSGNSVQAAPLTDPLTGTVHSRRLIEGVPLGGVGTGSIQVMTDGAISHVALTGNPIQPTGDSVGDRPGCFAAIRTTVSGRTRAKVLALHSAYSLPTAARLDFTGLTPRARLDCHDMDLPISASLLAFSPLVPFVLKASSYPAALFVFRLRNPLPITAEVSVVLSWESLLGVENSGQTGPQTGQRGLASTIPSSEGYFGVRFSTANSGAARATAASSTSSAAISSASVSATSGADEMVLMTYPQLPEATVTTATWNARDARPGWWDTFERTGDVTGVVSGMQSTVHPAGAVAIRFMLKPNGAVDLPFVVAWYLPHTAGAQGEEVGRYYQSVFTDARYVGSRALADWSSLYEIGRA